MRLTLNDLTVSYQRVTRSLKRKYKDHGYEKNCFVLVPRNVAVDQLALTLNITRRIVQRRNTVCNSEGLVESEHDLEHEHDKENHPPMHPILKTIGVNNRPFNLRGRRKSTSSLQNYVNDDDLINMDDVRLTNQNVQGKPLPGLIPLIGSSASKRSAQLVPLHQIQPSTSEQTIASVISSNDSVNRSGMNLLQFHGRSVPGLIPLQQKQTSASEQSAQLVPAHQIQPSTSKPTNSSVTSSNSSINRNGINLLQLYDSDGSDFEF